MSVNTNTNVVVVQQCDKDVKIGLVSLMLIAGLIAVVIQFWWQIMIISAVFTALVWSFMRWREQALQQVELAARADQQHQWLMENDPRGIYGDSHEGPIR